MSQTQFAQLAALIQADYFFMKLRNTLDNAAGDDIDVDADYDCKETTNILHKRNSIHSTTMFRLLGQVFGSDVKYCICASGDVKINDFVMNVDGAMLGEITSNLSGYNECLSQPLFPTPDRDVCDTLDQKQYNQLKAYEVMTDDELDEELESMHLGKRTNKPLSMTINPDKKRQCIVIDLTIE